MKKITLALLALLSLGSSALAQSSPGLVFGEVPTPAQWNSFFSAKQNTLGYTPLNVAGGSMSGPLITAASIAGAAGINVPPGVAPTSPNNGDMWTTTAGLFVRINGSTQIASVSVLPAANGGTGINNGASTITVAGNLATTAALTITAGTSNQIATWTDANDIVGASVLPFTVTVPTGGTGQTTFTANLPILGNGASGLIQGTVSGSTTKFATTTGAITSGHCASWDGSGNVVDAGGTCTTGGGGGTVASSTIGQVAVYTGATTVTGSNSFTFSAGALTLGVASTTAGTLTIEGGASGAVILAARSAAGTPTVTFGTSTGTPAVTGTAPLTINVTTGNINIAGTAGMVLAGSGATFTANPVLGVNASVAGSLGIANGGALGTTITLQNLGATAAYNLNLATTAGVLNQVNTSGGGGATSNSWQNIASLLTPGAGMGITGTVNAVISCLVSTTSVSGCVKPDGSSITIAAGVLSGAVFVFYPQCTLNGTVDCSAIINTAIGVCATGGEVVLPVGTILVNAGINFAASTATFTGTGSGTNLTTSAVTGVINIGSTITGTGVPANTFIVSQSSGVTGGAGVYVTNNATTSSGAALTATSTPSGCVLRGGGTYQEFTGSAGAQLATNFPTQGTVLYQTSTANNAITTGGNHVYIHDVAFRQSQPADANGFTPTAYKPSICCSSQVDIERVFFWNVYTGIQVGITGTQASGRTRINNVSGTAFNILIDVQFSADFGWINNIECAPFALMPGGVTTGQNFYVSTHATCISLERVDEWTLGNINVFSEKIGIVENHTTDGDANWVHVNDFHCDGCQQGILINGCAQMTFSNVLILGTGTIAGSVGVNVPGSSCTLTNNILTFTNLAIHGPGNQCVAANTVDLAVVNYECFAFNGAATGTAGSTMNSGAIMTIGGRYNVNNQGNTGGGGGGAQSGAGTFFTSNTN